ncbi:MAG: hypothetical protein ACRCX2_11310 [Paraclostridium sp.]
MTIEKLIEELSKIEDKKKLVFMVSECEGWIPINYIHSIDKDEYCTDEDCVCLSEYSYVGA